MQPALAVHVASFAALAAVTAWWAIAQAGAAPLPSGPVSMKVETVGDETGGTVPRDTRAAITRELGKSLSDSGFAVVRRKAQATLEVSILACQSSSAPEMGTDADTSDKHCVVTAIIIDNKTRNIVTKLVIRTPGLAGNLGLSNRIDRATAPLAQAVAQEVARSLGRAQAGDARSTLSEDLTATGARVMYLGNGLFEIGRAPTRTNSGVKDSVIDLMHVTHAHDPAIDKDVPYYTNITLNDRVPPLIDAEGREYAVITLYHVNPPLMGLPSREPGIDRGLDFRDAANLVKATYSNYVSPVLTNDAERRPVSSHPIGHFYVKVEIPGYPTVLTGMTTIARADTELADLTVGRELGIGGVLLTPQPGRLNSAMEAMEELTLRQRELRVIDGFHYRQVRGKNAGPEYVQEDGNVVFARFLVPSKNARDATAFFVEFLARGEHNIFGSLINRPNKGTGAGCTPFAIAWLEASGVIPFIEEPTQMPQIGDAAPESFGAEDFWRYLLRAINIPWRQIGCDDRVGANRVIPADLTVYDLLFHRESREFIKAASEGLAQKIKDQFGRVAGTLFQYGALTPIRDLVIHSKRKDLDDLGDYNWAKDGDGLGAPFWDNSRFASWIRRLWARGSSSKNIKLVREGRFYGVEVDAMTAVCQQEPFFAEADRIAEKKHRIERDGLRPSSCEVLFSLGLQ